MRHRSKSTVQIGLTLCASLGVFSQAYAQSDESGADAATALDEAPSDAIIVTGQRERGCPPSSKASEEPTEIVLDGMDIVEVKIRGRPVRLEVNPGMTGPVILNPDIVERFRLLGERDLTWDFGAFLLPAATIKTRVDFGCPGKKSRRLAWSGLVASKRADGVIGPHDLPYDRVTFKLSEPTGQERVEQFKLKRVGGRRYARLGTEIELDGEKMFALFSLDVGPNVVSARTANFLATRYDGGFVADSDSQILMIFDLPRPTREMRLSYPLEIAGLEIERFAVRVEDHGRPDNVGEVEEDDPRFEEGRIVVNDRKRRGRSDVVTRIGRDQYAHCSRLTYDLTNKVGYLACPVGN